MKKITLLLFSILISTLTFGQKGTSEKQATEPETTFSLETENPNAQVVVFIESESYRIENLKDLDLDPNSIESVSVHKDEITRKVYGNKNGAILIYIKKEYGKEVLKKIEKVKEKTLPGQS